MQEFLAFGMSHFKVLADIFLVFKNMKIFLYVLKLFCTILLTSTNSVESIICRKGINFGVQTLN